MFEKAPTVGYFIWFSCLCGLVLFVLDTMESVEKECGALGGLFQAIVNDMKVMHMETKIDKANMWAFVMVHHTRIYVLLPLSLAPGPPPTGNAAAGQTLRWNMFPFVLFA